MSQPSPTGIISTPFAMEFMTGDTQSLCLPRGPRPALEQGDVYYIHQCIPTWSKQRRRDRYATRWIDDAWFIGCVVGAMRVRHVAHTWETQEQGVRGEWAINGKKWHFRFPPKCPGTMKDGLNDIPSQWFKTWSEALIPGEDFNRLIWMPQRQEREREQVRAADAAKQKHELHKPDVVSNRAGRKDDRV